MAVTINGSTGITTPADTVPEGRLYPLVSGTAQASTSGTSIDFTSIPSWVKRITVMYSGVSTNGTSYIIAQIGAGSVETTGYLANAGLFDNNNTTRVANSTAGFPLYNDNASYAYTGSFTITLLGSNTWICSGVLALSGSGRAYTISGNKTTSGTLDRVRITTANGTDTFDAGSINILYE